MGIYYALFEDDPAGGFSVSFPDLGYGGTQGETTEEALEMAEDLLKCILAELIKSGEPLPAPRKHRGGKYRPVSLPALESAKVDLYLAFRESGITRAELARRIGSPKPNVERLFDLGHVSRLDQLEAAFRAIGKKLDISVRNAA